MMESQVEQAELLLIPDPRLKSLQEIFRGVGCIHWNLHEIYIVAFLRDLFPCFDMRVQICQEELDW